MAVPGAASRLAIIARWAGGGSGFEDQRLAPSLQRRAEPVAPPAPPRLRERGTARVSAGGTGGRTPPAEAVLLDRPTRRRAALQAARSLSPRPSHAPAALAAKGRLIRCAVDGLTRSSRRETCTADHLPPRAAGMPRASSSAAMARNDSQPAACSSFTVVGKIRCPRLRSCPLGRIAGRAGLRRQP